MNELTSVCGANAVIVAQAVNNDNGGVARYVIVNFYGDWFLMTVKNLNRRHT